MTTAKDRAHGSEETRMEAEVGWVRVYGFLISTCVWLVGLDRKAT